MKTNYLINEKLKEMGLLTIEEARKLFNCGNVWADKTVLLICKMAFCMGLRKNEVLAIRRENVFDDFISIEGTYNILSGYKDYYFKRRNVPLLPEIKNELDGLIKVNLNGYLFSADGGSKPISSHKINKHFNMALNKIGISNAEKRNRNLSFHSLRWSFINYLRKEGISDYKIKRIIGTDNATQFIRYYEPDKNEVIDI
jgi:integrase